MKKYSNVLIIIYSTVVLSLISGIALSKERDLVKDNTVKIERVASKYAVVTNVNVRQIDSVLSVYGTIKKRPTFGRGPVPGHIDTEVIEPNGRTVSKKNVRYIRNSTVSRLSKFNFNLDIEVAPGSTLRVVHHDALPHDS